MALTISEKGWVVIPAELRKKYNLTPGTEVVIVDYGGVLAIVPAMKDPVKQGYGMLKGGPPLTTALLKERAAERKREEAKIKKHYG
jgi:AbrB family looped-hinge helix DNA binding protein